MKFNKYNKKIGKNNFIFTTKKYLKEKLQKSLKLDLKIKNKGFN